MVLGDDGVFSERAETILGHAREHPVARCEAGDAGTDRLQDAGELIAHHGRQGVALHDPELAFARLEVHGVQAGGAHAHQHFPQAGVRPWPLAQLGRIGPAVPGQDKRSHRPTMPEAQGVEYGGGAFASGRKSGGAQRKHDPDRGAGPAVHGDAAAELMGQRLKQFRTETRLGFR